MGHCKPQDGGCWYCHTDDPPLSFCSEFDTYIHIKCIEDELAKPSSQYDPELEIIAIEFGLTNYKEKGGD